MMPVFAFFVFVSVNTAITKFLIMATNYHQLLNLCLINALIISDRNTINLRNAV